MSTKDLNNYAVIVLAAGSSSRLGQPKQLIQINEVTLLNHTIQKVKRSCVNDIYIVLGASVQQITPTLESDSSIIMNKDWELGMGKSIATAIDNIDTLNYDGVIIVLSDQVHLEAINIDNLIEVHKSESKGIVVSKYKNGQGPPSFFSKKYFGDLLQLNDDNGAKPIVKANYTDVCFARFDNGHIDIDTPDDLEQFHVFDI